MINKVLSGFLLVLCFMLLASCAKDDFAEPLINDLQEISERAPVVPFKATYTTYPIEYQYAGYSFDCSEVPPYLVIPGEGNGTHIGNSQWESNSWVIPLDEFSGEQFGCHTFIAADGSTLTGDYCGIIYFGGTGPDGQFIFGQGTGDYYLDVGTKRFKNATGKGTYSYYVELPNEEGILVGHLTFDGELDKNGKTLELEGVCGYVGPE